MPVLRLFSKNPEDAEFAKAIAAENNGAIIDTGHRWHIEAHPKIVIKRTIFDKFYGKKPKWDQDGLWRGLILSYEGYLNKQADDEYLIEDV